VPVRSCADEDWHLQYMCAYMDPVELLQGNIPLTCSQHNTHEMYVQHAATLC
jgi:hypothetical protein